MSQAQGPRIGIIGTGAIGGFYGVMLARAGFDVHFLLRSEYPAVVRDGIHINSAVHGQLHLQPVQAYEDAAKMPPCDWLLVGAKTTSNTELAPLLVQIAAPGAKVVLLQNGLAVEEALRPLLPDSLHLLGGLCFICVHRAAAGRIVHQAYGGINLGYHSGPGDGEAVLAEGVALLRQAAIEANPVANLAQARWQKLVWNVPYNGLSVLLNSGTAAMMQQADSRALIASLMEEVITAAAGCGHSLPEGLADDLLLATDRKGGGTSVLELFRNGLAIRTLALWLAFFCCLLMVYALSSWLPKLMANAGYSLGSSLSFLLALNFGGMAGAILGGWLGDRYNLVKVKVAFFIAAALSISLLGVNSPMPILYLLIFIAGATTIGTQILLYAGAAQLYGLSVRSTGLGWASGIGRNGAIVGPLLGGALMGINLPLQLNFMAFAIPGAIAAIAMSLFAISAKRRQRPAGELVGAKA